MRISDVSSDVCSYDLLRHLETGVLECANRFAERLPVFHIFKRDIESGLSRGHEANGRNKSLLRQKTRKIFESFRWIPQNIVLGHLDVIKEELCRILGMETHLLELPPTFEPFHAALDQEKAKTMT